MNIFIVTGALGHDSELSYTKGGTPVLKFSIANNVIYKDNKKTSWFNCTMFGSRAEKLVQYLVKGTKLLVTGELEVRKYEKKDGGTGISVEIFVKEIEFIGGKKPEQQAAESSSNNAADDDNVPF